MMQDVAASRPTFHALLIGIDRYRPNRLPDNTTYASLGGCVADVLRVEAMLRARVEGATLAVTRLLSPEAGASVDGTPDTEDALPTSVNIVNALDALVVRAAPGDQVYIHYSGHGGRVDTVFAELKGASARDETLVPMDIGSGAGIDPSRYLRDLHLAYYLDAFAGKVDPVTGAGIAVTLVCDSCHSGGVTRGTDIAFRGPTRLPADPTPAIGAGVSPDAPIDALDALDTIDALDTLDAAPDWSARLTPARLATLWEARNDALATRGIAADVRWLPPPRGHVLLAACRETEVAAEASIDGRPRGGVMTDALLTAIDSLGAEQSWKTLHDRVLACVHSAFPQVPQLLGEVERQALGVTLLPARERITVQSIDATARAVTLDAGLSATIQPGAEIAIYAPGTLDFSLPTAQVATGVVTRAGAVECVVALAASADLAAIAPGAPALLLGVPMRRRVQRVTRADAPHPGESAALAAVATTLAAEGRGFLHESAAGEAPHYLVGVDPAGRFEVLRALDQPIPYLDPPIAIDAPAAASTLVDRLLRLNRFDTLHELRALPSRLADAVTLGILLSPKGWKPGDPMEGVGAPAPRANGTCVVPDGAFVLLRVTNRGSADVNVAIADLQCDWGITILVPDPQLHTAFEVVPAGSTRTFAIQAFIPPGFGDTQDVYKLFAAVGPIDFRWLEQPPMNAPFARGNNRGGAAVNALQRLVASLDAADRTRVTTRHAAPVSAPDAQWMTTQVRVLVTRTPA